MLECRVWFFCFAFKSRLLTCPIQRAQLNIPLCCYLTQATNPGNSSNTCVISKTRFVYYYFIFFLSTTFDISNIYNFFNYWSFVLLIIHLHDKIGYKNQQNNNVDFDFSNIKININCTRLNFVGVKTEKYKQMR